jgi:UDP-glucose 4-epimerase
MSKKILILGGHGFIGSHTSNILRKQGHIMGVVDCYHQYYIFPDDEYQCILNQRQEHANADHVFVGKIENVNFMASVFAEFQPDVVIHLATYPNAYMVKRNVVDATNNMITATATTLDLCAEHNVEKIVFSSSSMVYGNFESDAPDENSKTDPRTLYGSYKLQGERMCQIWRREKELNYTILRPSALYGTRDMIVRVISKMAESSLTNGNIRVQGPDNKLDFSWVTDVADAFAVCATNETTTNEIFNCTRGNGRTILEAATMIQQRLGGDIEIHPHDSFYPNRDTLNSNKLKEFTGWNPTEDIDAGIPNYLDWLLEQPFIKTLPRYQEVMDQ